MNCKPPTLCLDGWADGWASRVRLRPRLRPVPPISPGDCGLALALDPAFPAFHLPTPPRLFGITDRNQP